MVGRRTVLVAEDDDNVRELATFILEREGYRVIAVEHGKRAMTIIEGIEHIDLVFTDLKMPHMGGVELGRHIARICPGMPVLYTSGHTDVADEIEPGSLFLKKPYKPQDLTSAIAKTLYGLKCPDRAPSEVKVIDLNRARHTRSRQ